MKPCKHLDYDGDYGPDIEIVDVHNMPGVRYWHRGTTWTETADGGPPNPSKVQFCKLRGRINGVFQCYNQGEMHCYELDTNNTEDDAPAL